MAFMWETQERKKIKDDCYYISRLRNSVAWWSHLLRSRSLGRKVKREMKSSVLGVPNLR